jgi:hypothetical protein
MTRSTERRDVGPQQLSFPSKFPPCSPAALPYTLPAKGRQTTFCKTTFSSGRVSSCPPASQYMGTTVEQRPRRPTTPTAAAVDEADFNGEDLRKRVSEAADFRHGIDVLSCAANSIRPFDYAFLRLISHRWRRVTWRPYCGSPATAWREGRRSF